MKMKRKKKEKTGEKEKTLPPPHQSICYTSAHPQ
jgi:hypothetical protein